MFMCSKLSEWKRNISISKHINRTNLNNLEQEYAKTDKYIYLYNIKNIYNSKIKNNPFGMS